MTPGRPDTRCTWASTALSIAYHDAEWGVPVHEDRVHFEFLTLEGAQAGLSWETILKKRARYRVAFADFDPARVSRFTPARVERLLEDPGLVRNRLKIESTVTNARAFLAVQKEFGSFDTYVWRFVDGTPRVNARRSLRDVPASTTESDALSRDLKARGFRFVGTTICYAYMQAVGLVNDHLVGCFRRHSSALALAVMLAIASAQSSGAQASDSAMRALRESLRSADRALSGYSAMKGFTRSYDGVVSGDFVMLLEGAPIVRGRDAVTGLLERQERFRGMSVAWQPFRVLVSKDGTLGVTFGTTAIRGPGLDEHSFGRYVSVWRRGSGDTWQLAAQVQNGLLPPGTPVTPPGDVPGAISGGSPSDPFALADVAFARMARDSTAPAAFGRFSAPNAVTFGGGGELNIGPADIQARLAEGPAARAAWRWAPVLTIAAESGDLGVTIGEAEIQAPGAAAPAFSKYLTVWLRMPNGELKYVVDAGNARPPRRP